MSGISDYSTTPASNTAINGINIAELCNASNINDAIRQFMADVKADLFSSRIPWVAAGGTVSAITATYAPNAIASLTDGLLLSFSATDANTSTTPTFSPNGLTAHTIVKAGGQALLAGDIPRANYECVVRYNLANTRWELLNPSIPTNAMNVKGVSYAATGMPGNITLASLTGAPRFNVTATYFGRLINNNGTIIVPKLSAAVKDGGSTLQSAEYSVTVASGYSDYLCLTWVFDVIAPASDYTITITDTETDGGSHSYTNSYLSVSAVSA